MSWGSFLLGALAALVARWLFGPMSCADERAYATWLVTGGHR